MQLIAPVTDYIPASILTTQGDIVVRGAVIPQRLGSGGNNSVMEGKGAGAIPYFDWIDGVANRYYKGQGVGTPSIFEALALSDTGIHIGTDTRNAGGAQVITGVGFEPSVVIFLAIDDTYTNMNYSVGFDINTLQGCAYFRLNHTECRIATDRSMCIRRTVTDALFGAISALGADGFTFTWTLAGACSLEFIYLCLP